MKVNRSKEEILATYSLILHGVHLGEKRVSRVPCTGTEAASYREQYSGCKVIQQGAYLGPERLRAAPLRAAQWMWSIGASRPQHPRQNHDSGDKQFGTSCT